VTKCDNNGNGDDEDTVVKELYIAATAEDIFPYLTDPRHYVLWMGVGARIDAQPGGAYQIDLNGVDSVIGEYLEVDPPHRLKFTWSCIGRDYTIPNDLSTVEIDLIPSGDGTLLRLTHRGPDRSGRDRHDAGWNYYLGRFALVLSGKDPGPDPKADPSYRHHGEAPEPPPK
jgi:uncharacterized protein YndB with AHSA1/START domain